MQLSSMSAFAPNSQLSGFGISTTAFRAMKLKLSAFAATFQHTCDAARSPLWVAEFCNISEVLSLWPF